MSTTENREGNPEGFEDSDLIETYLDGETVYRGSFFNVEKDRVCLPNGAIATREYIRHPGAVVILPLFDDGTVLLERQFRFPVNRIFLEFPAGKIDKGEDTLDSAKRELKEETGYSASNWQYVTTIHNAIGYSDEQLIVYLAKDLQAGMKKNSFRPSELRFPNCLNGSKMAQLLTSKPSLDRFGLKKL